MKIKKAIKAVIAGFSTTFIGVYILKKSLLKYIDDRDNLVKMLDQLYSEKNYRCAIVTNPMNNRYENNKYDVISPFSISSDFVHENEMYFDNDKINKQISKYLTYSGTNNTTSVKDMIELTSALQKPFNNINPIILNKKQNKEQNKEQNCSPSLLSSIKDVSELTSSFQRSFNNINPISNTGPIILIKEQNCPPSLLSSIKDDIISVKQYFKQHSDVMLWKSLVPIWNHDNSVDVRTIDARECKDIDIETLNNLRKNNSTIKFVITDRSKPGEELAELFQHHAYQITFVGEYDKNIIENMKSAFSAMLGPSYITTMNENISDVLKKLYNYKQVLFIEGISSMQALKMVHDIDIYGKVAFVSASVNSKNFTFKRLPKASGGNYVYNMTLKHYVCDTIDNMCDREPSKKLLQHCIKNNISSVIFTCNYINNYFPKLFLDCCRERNYDIKVYVVNSCENIECSDNESNVESICIDDL